MPVKIVKSDVRVDVGVPIEEVYTDPAYGSVPFVVYRDGVKYAYSIRGSFNGRATVSPVELDSLTLKQLNMVGDREVSETARINPKATETCPACGVLMYEPIAVQQFMAGSISLPMQRELACSSGHKRCTNCWSDHVQTQVRERTQSCFCEY